MKFNPYLFVNNPIRFLLVFAVILSVLFSCSERGSDLFEFENEEEEEFEEHFLLEMENKMPELLAEFKKGALPEEAVKKMVEMAKGIMGQYRK